MNNCLIADLLAYNKGFVARAEGQPFKAQRKPAKHLALVTCLDTRLTTMLPAALGLRNGDASIIKVAGAEVDGHYGAVMRSLLVAVHQLGVQDIMVIAHTDCGAQGMSCFSMSTLMKQAGITDEVFEAARIEGINLEAWLEGFSVLEESVRCSVGLIRTHPFIPSSGRVQGFIIDSDTGELTEVA
ncbi:MAG: carbonic anhydrase [Coriobacteriales bacterium]|nr:carbonic anhydrase [Coriobacteriales bacterium]